ncbi:lysozyme-like [Dreissena polymorpha]|uniref:lysozyme n=1 Tax=Dreissena polymorpha TaxID=45954 RepID=A0A9D4KC82_DREPO|nr:lysozyme-like [Dreissena polymorpha]KAH3837170.1 hypothetical protein DPMN_110550 [Dreissena polymorpha]
MRHEYIKTEQPKENKEHHLTMLGLVIFASVACVAVNGWATGLVSQECMQCICLQESGCVDPGCKMDVGSLSCGYFQIKEAYWIDCGRPGGSWKTCASDKTCASQCVQAYMARYVDHFHCPHTCESYAREHNGGPNGCHSASTVDYWHRLLTKPGCAHVH